MIITSSQPNVLAVNAALPVQSVKELVDVREGQSGQAQLRLGRQRQLVAPRRWSCSSPTAGIDIVHVPFNGSPPAVTATIQGETQMMFAVMPPLQAQIQAGKLRAIAVTTAQALRAASRSADHRGSRATPDFEALAWNGILVAGGHAACRSCSASTPRSTRSSRIPRCKSTLNAQGFDLVGGTPEDFARSSAANRTSGRR